MQTATERFLRYVQIDTQSLPGKDCIPSTEKQKDLARLLVSELQEIGISNAFMDEHGYVYASLPASPGMEQVPAVGFIAHMDTSNAVSGKNVHPQIIRQYDGGDIILNEALNLRLSPDEYPDLKRYEGEDLIVTDGTTLLGADDKAGIAEIMALAELLTTDPSILHGPVKIGFTPDEEVGHGVDLFNLSSFGAEFAYTVDGGLLGELGYETFNAAGLELTVHGVSTHPGSAKGKMKNALLLLMEFHSMLPVFDNPMYTEGYEGFYHLDEMQGNVDQASASYIIRDHDRVSFEARKQQVQEILEYLNRKYGAGTFEAKLEDSYYNMREIIEQHWTLIDHAEEALRTLGYEPVSSAIRGGTDGCRLSFMGLPCPNLCTGGHNFHGRYEYISCQSLEKAVLMLKNILTLYTQD